MGLLGIECKCKQTFCTSCRYPEKHGCSYDYYTAEREILRLQNPKICAEKIVKV
jgi:AN1-like Zinc finger